MKLAFCHTLATTLLLLSLTGTALAADKSEISGSSYTLRISNASGIELQDDETGARWTAKDLGRVQLADGQTVELDLSRASIEARRGKLMLRCALPGPRATSLLVYFSTLRDGKGFEVAYEVLPAEVQIQSATLLPSLFSATRHGRGSLVIPVREGLLIPADSGLNFRHRFDTYAYEGCHMAMFGLLEKGAAVLFSWNDPYVAVDVTSHTPTNSPAANQTLTPSLSLRKSAKSFQVRLLGRGDHVDIAQSYRELAKAAGWFVPWEKKLKENPERAALLGAINFKLWSTLDRRMNEDSSKELSARVNWTFDEAAQVAEHLKRDLELEKVLFMMGGWIRRGYDNQHPDVLPAAPECGGNEALSRCGQRIRELGYMFCLHDNYQDIYKDSPSWDERFIMKTADGKLSKGGHWAGGVAYLTCSKMALELAQRPQNLRAIKEVSHANSYFIDTTYAAGLQECFEPQHPLTRADDMHWKQALSEYSRDVFGTFGSECGREWAIPHSDFFEGLTGVSGGFYHDAALVSKLGATVVPMFEMVYRDCIAMYGKYGYDHHRAANYVLHHISIGRPLNYHSIPPHLYWQKPDADGLPLRVSVSHFKPLSSGEFQVSYRWEVTGPLPDSGLKAFVHFTDASGQIKFQNDYAPEPELARWTNGVIEQGPFTVRLPDGASGTFGVRAGLFDPETGARASLLGRDNGERSYSLGRLKATAQEITFEPQQQPTSTAGDPALFTRGDKGWTDGLHSLDRFVKNTYEVLSPLNELTARVPMTDHNFLTPDRSVQQTVFGKGRDSLVVIVNGGSSNHIVQSKMGGSVTLPPGGFLAESPRFVAFHAASFGGQTYTNLPLFTLRSLDGRPLDRSRKIRVYHGFGEPAVAVNGHTHQVLREILLP